MRVLVVEDEAKIARLIARALTEEGHEVEVSADGLEAVGRVAQARTPYDAAILDVMLPGLDGVALCRRLRARQPGLGIVMISARAALDDRLAGLSSGADDYLGKPFALAELLLRFQALERRLAQAAEPGRAQGGWRLDPIKHLLHVHDKAIALSPREAALLSVFIRHVGQTLDRALLAEAAWDTAFDTGTNHVDVYVNYLRRKLGQAGVADRLKTERGEGYRLEPLDA